MPALMIRCPKTGKQLPTGVSMSEEQLQTATLSTNGVKCPHCGEIHDWNKQDAFFSQQPPINYGK